MHFSSPFLSLSTCQTWEKSKQAADSAVSTGDGSSSLITESYRRIAVSTICPPPGWSDHFYKHKFTSSTGKEDLHLSKYLTLSGWGHAKQDIRHTEMILATVEVELDYIFLFFPLSEYLF